MLWFLGIPIAGMLLFAGIVDRHRKKKRSYYEHHNNTTSPDSRSDEYEAESINYLRGGNNHYH